GNSSLSSRLKNGDNRIKRRSECFFARLCGLIPVLINRAPGTAAQGLLRAGGRALRYLASFRRRLAIVATLGMALHMLMAFTLLYTAQAASQVTAAATASQERTRQFSELQFAADRYHRAAYAVLSVPDAQRQNELTHA